jgi:hypothetical protein
MEIWALLVSAGLYAAATSFDVEATTRGLQLGLAEEGNPIIRKLFGPRPARFDLYLYEWTFFVLGVFLYLLAMHFGSWKFEALIWGGLFGASVGHVRGGLAWHKLSSR